MSLHQASSNMPLPAVLCSCVVQAAAALGMPSLLFEGADSLQAQLKKRGLEF